MKRAVFIGVMLLSSLGGCLPKWQLRVDVWLFEPEAWVLKADIHYPKWLGVGDDLEGEVGIFIGDLPYEARWECEGRFTYNRCLIVLEGSRFADLQFFGFQVVPLSDGSGLQIQYTFEIFEQILGDFISIFKLENPFFQFTLCLHADALPREPFCWFGLRHIELQVRPMPRPWWFDWQQEMWFVQWEVQQGLGALLLVVLLVLAWWGLQHWYHNRSYQDMSYEDMSDEDDWW